MPGKNITQAADAALFSGRRAVTGITFTALFAALIASGAFVAIPVGPVPIGLQNFFALLSGLILGPFLGAASVALFLAAGITGLPVFANNGSPMGIARLVGPTGGYLFGYLAGAAAAGLIAGFPRPGNNLSVRRLVLATLAGFLVVYIPGVVQLKMILNISWSRAITVGFYPFLAGDALKGIAAALITRRLRRTAAGLLSR